MMKKDLLVLKEVRFNVIFDLVIILFVENFIVLMNEIVEYVGIGIVIFYCYVESREKLMLFLGYWVI